MTDDTKPREPPAGRGRDTGALLLAGGGLAAAFGAASCCALPIVFGSVGLGSAWLATVAWVAAPHRTALLIAALVCLVAGGGVFLWRRRTASCVSDAICARPVGTMLMIGLLSLGTILSVLGYLYA
jgi:mercuric ion transport protein